ncbi:MAG TPA: DUF4173 domain-containing protein [Longimicrobiales bacterium]
MSARVTNSGSSDSASSNSAQSGVARVPGSLRDHALPAALLLGFLADQVLRAPGRPALNITLWALAATALLWIVSRRRAAPVSRETWGLVLGAVACSVLLLFRDADALAVFCMFSAVLLLGLAAGRGGSAWAVRAHIVDVAASAIRVGLFIITGPLGWLRGEPQPVPGRPLTPAPATRSWRRSSRVVVRGTVMALPPLLLLGALLMSADPVFDHILRNAFFFDVDTLLEHVAVACVIAWLTSGYMRAFLVDDASVMAHAAVPRPAIAPSEIAFALSLLNVLFIAFLVVQVRYLFGGAELVQVTAGLSYADYARRGFFELVAATALVVPVLLIAEWAAAEDASRRRALRIAATVLVVLLGGVLASAAYRMKLYQDAYGLTEDRLYGSVFMVWLTFLLVWLAVTVLRGRRRGFVFAAVVGGLACIVALHVLNPHAMIARVNLARAAAGSEYDGRYLTTLSADAVPTLIARMPRLPAAERCRVEEMLVKRWSGDRPGGWLAWNLGDARARRLVRGMAVTPDCGVVAMK